VTAADHIRSAAQVLDGVARRTPIVTSRTLDRLVGASVFLKIEALQRTGSFKFRGAYTKIASLPRGTGVLAYSSGNHAQAVALAASLLGSQALILMPSDAPQSKLDATRGYGASVTTYDRYREDREALANDLAAVRNLEIVPPYDDPLIMAGQGTSALELLEDVRALDLLVVPLGGGGLLSGCATIARAAGVGRVVGVEPEAGDDWRRSFEARERVRIEVPRTIADGLQTHEPGRLTWEVVSRLTDEVVTVTDAEIVEAMRFAFERLKIVIEPSGAVALAALLTGAVSAPDGRVGVIVSGGNISADRLVELLASPVAVG
jgi:threonine dehydratase